MPNSSRRIFESIEAGCVSFINGLCPSSDRKFYSLYEWGDMSHCTGLDRLNHRHPIGFSSTALRISYLTLLRADARIRIEASQPVVAFPPSIVYSFEHTDITKLRTK